MPKFVSTDPGTVYWMDIFHEPIYCKICNVCLNKTRINEKEVGVGPFKIS